MVRVSISIDADEPRRAVPQATTDHSRDAAAPVRRKAAPVPSMGRRRQVRSLWWLLRLVVTAQTIDAFLQPVFEGRFLSGDFAMLSLHRTNGTFVGALSMTAMVVALVAWRLAGVPGRVVAGVVVLGPLAGLQIFLGFSRVLGIHVPLGVALIALSGWLVVWLWTHHPGTGKPAAERRELA